MVLRRREGRRGPAQVRRRGEAAESVRPALPGERWDRCGRGIQRGGEAVEPAGGAERRRRRRRRARFLHTRDGRRDDESRCPCGRRGSRECIAAATPQGPAPRSARLARRRIATARVPAPRPDVRRIKRNGRRTRRALQRGAFRGGRGGDGGAVEADRGRPSGVFDVPLRRRFGTPANAPAFAVRHRVRPVFGWPCVRRDGQLPGGATCVRVVAERVSAPAGRHGGVLHGAVAPQEGDRAQLFGAGVRVAGQAGAADVVRAGELFQPPEGARDCAAVLPAGAATRPALHLRSHPLRARILRKRGF